MYCTHPYMDVTCMYTYSPLTWQSCGYYFFNSDMLRNFFRSTISSWLRAAIHSREPIFLLKLHPPRPPQITSHLPGRRSNRTDMRTWVCLMVLTWMNNDKALWLAVTHHTVSETDSSWMYDHIGLSARTSSLPKQPLLPGPSPHNSHQSHSWSWHK